TRQPGIDRSRTISGEQSRSAQPAEGGPATGGRIGVGCNVGRIGRIGNVGRRGSEVKTGLPGLAKTGYGYEKRYDECDCEAQPRKTRPLQRNTLRTKTANSA